MRSGKRRQHSSGRSRSWPVVLAATAVICLLATLPLILPALHVHLQPIAATSSNGVTLLGPPKPAQVPLPPVAQPIEPGQPPAVLPAVDAAREAATVRAEDHRLRTMLHQAIHVSRPEVIRVGGSLPTLVLTAGSRAYTAADLVHHGALVMLRNHAAVLLDNLFVSVNAQLSLGGPGLRSLYMETGSGRFASIVGWGGSLSFHGTNRQPLTIMSWNRADNAPAADQGDGRSYIREMGGNMTLTNVRVSSLGFWSGRTAGVAWTGLTGRPSTGGASNSRFIANTYGAFLSRSSGVTFRDDLFELNELDGLRIHRNSTNTLVVSSSASRNGGNGFVVSRATQASLLDGDVAEHNGANGFYVDGRPLVNGASASGGSTTPGSGATVEDSVALDNGKTGILIEGGNRTVIKADQVCAAVTAIAVRYGATNPVLTGNYIGCASRTGISVGPSAPGAMVSGNAVVGARMGILVRNSGPVELDNNHISGASVFGITVRGPSSKVAGVGNVLVGSGFRAVDARADASPPALSATNLSGWVHHIRITFWSYLRFHPLAALWLGIAILVLAAALRSHRRKLLPHPYPASTRSQRGTTDVTAAGPWPARPRAPARSGAATAPFPAFTVNARAGEAREQFGVAYGHHAQTVRRAAPPVSRAAPPVSRAARPAGDRTRRAPPWAPMPEPAPGPGRAADGNGRHSDVFGPATLGEKVVVTSGRRSTGPAAVIALLAITLVGCGLGGQSTAPQGSPAAVAPVTAHSPVTGDRLCGNTGQVVVSSADELRNALASAQPGETIVLAAGTYDGDFAVSRSGTQSEPITLCGPRDAVLVGESIARGYTIHLEHASWWRLMGFTVQGGQKGVMADSSSNDLLYGLYVHSTGDEAIHLRDFSSHDTISHSVVRDTGLLVQFFGEGIYVGSAHKNWCRYSGCQPDRSDDNIIADNNVADTTAENIDIKEGTTGGQITGNQFNGTGMAESAATAWVNVKGNDWLITDNTGVDSIKDGFQVHQVYPGWGMDNTFRGNRADVNGPGYGFYIQSKKLNATAACDNTVSGAASGFSTIPCA